MASNFDEVRAKKERSPSFPFISLPKAIDRSRAFFDAHRREPTRLGVLAETWSYSPASSGLQQTVAALKQFGLLDEIKSPDDRKVQITELARRILSDQRPGAKEQGIAEAAVRPRLIGEYLTKWLPFRPNDTHCISDLEFDRGFNQAAAKQFLKVFDETVAFAGLRDSDSDVDAESASVDLGGRLEATAETGSAGSERTPLLQPAATRDAGGTPLSERLQVVTTGNQLTVSAALVSGREVDKLIRILQANKALLDDDENVAEDSVSPETEA